MKTGISCSCEDCVRGKGGSGKTTLAALFARHLRDSAGSLLAIEADINQHLAAALGATEDQAVLLPSLGDHLPEIKEYLRGSNPRIASAEAMVKTTPPGRGSRLLRVAGTNPLYKVGAVELLLNHLVDGPGEYVVVA